MAFAHTEIERTVTVMDEYIERNEAIGALRRRLGPNTSPAQKNMLQLAAIDIRRIKTADVAPVRHGRWEKRGQEIYCSECGGESGHTWAGASRYSDYCPNCGAKMGGD